MDSALMELRVVDMAKLTPDQRSRVWSGDEAVLAELPAEAWTTVARPIESRVADIELQLAEARAEIEALRARAEAAEQRLVDL